MADTFRDFQHFSRPGAAKNGKNQDMMDFLMSLMA
jgi:hypothetical protein